MQDTHNKKTKNIITKESNTTKNTSEEHAQPVDEPADKPAWT